MCFRLHATPTYSHWSGRNAETDPHRYRSGRNSPLVPTNRKTKYDKTRYEFEIQRQDTVIDG